MQNGFNLLAFTLSIPLCVVQGQSEGPIEQDRSGGMSCLTLFVVSVTCSCILLESNSSYCKTTSCAYVYVLMDIRVVSNFDNYE